MRKTAVRNTALVLATAAYDPVRVEAVAREHASRVSISPKIGATYSRTVFGRSSRKGAQ